MDLFDDLFEFVRDITGLPFPPPEPPDSFDEIGDLNCAIGDPRFGDPLGELLGVVFGLRVVSSTGTLFQDIESLEKVKLATLEVRVEVEESVWDLLKEERGCGRGFSSLESLLDFDLVKGKHTGGGGGGIDD